MRVAILGNHSVSYSTESELYWTFERLGHQVFKFQEDSTTTDVVLEQCISAGVELFVYIHTHGWHTPGRISLTAMLKELEAKGIKTCGFHLDLYWGLNQLDAREDRVGTHPFWHTQYVFTADGGRQEEFKSRGVNHFWLPPAVVERGCYRGTPQASLATDVAFVGSEFYHPEYPFRAELIHWLGRTYGARFRRYNCDTSTLCFREQRLNDLYASVKVCVGDSCFAGIPYYWSDRVPETLGRGGFLVHPVVEGLNIPGLATFPAQNLEALKERIDYFLGHEEERRAAVDTASAHVAKHDTYTNRVTTMLETMELA